MQYVTFEMGFLRSADLFRLWCVPVVCSFSLLTHILVWIYHSSFHHSFTEEYLCFLIWAITNKCYKYLCTAFHVNMSIILCENKFTISTVSNYGKLSSLYSTELLS